MYKLQTELSNFKSKSSDCNYSPILITWYKLVQTETTFEFICFSKDELDLLTNFVANNKFNLNNQNYFSCSDESQDWTIESYKNFPDYLCEYLILTKEKMKNENMRKHTNTCEIELLKFDGSKNAYDLHFDIIGRIEF